MDLTLFEDFLAVLEHGSILAAAEAKGTSQPTLSRRIRELEDALNVPLLNRTSRGISATVYGTLFRRYAEQALQDHRATLEELRGLKSGAHGHARIGMAATFSGYLPTVISRLQANRPGATVEVVEGTYDALVQKILKRDIDGAFTMLPPDESLELLASTNLGQEPLVVVVNKDHPLTRKATVSLDSLGEEAWVVMNRPHSVRDGFLAFANANDLASPHIAVETSSLDFLKSMLKHSNLLTFLPRGAVHTELDDGQFKALNIPELPAVRMAFVHRHGVLPPLVMQIVFEMETTIRSLSS